MSGAFTPGPWRVGSGVFARNTILVQGTVDTYAGPVWSVMARVELIEATDSDGRHWYAPGTAEAKARELNYDIALGRKILNRLALAAADGGALWDSAPSQHARLERLGLVARQEDCAVITKAGRSALSRTEGQGGGNG